MDPGRQAGIIFGYGMGAMAATFFGGMWLALNLLIAKALSWWLAGAFAVCFVLLYAGSVRLIRRGKKLRSQTAERSSWPASRRKQFLWTTVAEVAGVAAVIVVCGWLGLYALIELGIALVVGLHFIPLAKNFQAPIYYLTSAAIIACCALSWVFLRAEKMDVVAGLGTGIVLWLTAAYTLIRARGLPAATGAGSAAAVFPE
jgi:hypothetical protein